MAHALTNMKQQRLAAGFSIGDLAKKALVGDWTIVCLENGGVTDVVSSQKIADALGVTLTTLGKKDL